MSSMYYVLSAKSATKLNYKIDRLAKDYSVKVKEFSASPGLFSVVLEVEPLLIYIPPTEAQLQAQISTYGFSMGGHTTQAKKPLSDLLKGK